jgi:hypothetical protein
MSLAVLCTPSQAVDQLYRLGALLGEHAAAGVLTRRLEQRTVMGPHRPGAGLLATPLAVAAASGALDQVRALLDAGADPRAQARIERTGGPSTATRGPLAATRSRELAINARHYAAALLVAAAIDREWRTWATRLFPTLREPLCAATPAQQLATALHRAGQLCEQGPPTSGAADRLKRRNAAMDDVALLLVQGAHPPTTALHACCRRVLASSYIHGSTRVHALRCPLCVPHVHITSL